MRSALLGLAALGLYASMALAQGAVPAVTGNVRVDTLLSRMTLAEKASEMQNNSAAVPRLNIPAYQWWSEALHGVINEGVTEYPEPIVDHDLREIDFGELEGLTYEEAERTRPDIYRAWMEAPTEVTFPDGESYAVLRARSLAALEDVRARHADGVCAIVSHGGPIRAILAGCLQMADAAIFRLAQGYGAVSVVEWLEGVPIVRMVNVPPAAVILAA